MMALLKSIQIFFFGGLMLCLVSTQALAQPENPVDVQDTPVPITGLEILFLAGGALGGYKAYKKKKDDKSEV
jgi:hypothetical protein